MHWTHWGIGLGLIGVGISVGGFNPHPIAGAFLTLAGVGLIAWSHLSTRLKPVHQKVKIDNEPSLTWQEIESRIHELRLKDINKSNRADGPLDAIQDQARDGRAVWRLSGSTKDIREEADRLFRMAGAKLRASGIASDSSRLQRDMSDRDRWLWFLVEIGKHTKHLEGHSANHPTTYSHWVRQVLDDALAACVECLARQA